MGEKRRRRRNVVGGRGGVVAWRMGIPFRLVAPAAVDFFFSQTRVLYTSSVLSPSPPQPISFYTNQSEAITEP